MSHDITPERSLPGAMQGPGAVLRLSAAEEAWACGLLLGSWAPCSVKKCFAGSWPMENCLPTSLF